ncbi:Aldolase-type TIM barrel domain and Glycoside hydrolase, superfamily domain and Hyaluronidase family-containing protein [Strongyloides ratti]|uniref:Hyaluronidase n=1 Tax=Strongyloides ratti TaxID=34506 RepID=A0A090LIY1_STRRB|nr:Aldolase-type TIM barrel domain and Glycoside hydrolase, superfamily domain and Hyaluronidase family-containing protein [Strongyloides ratti]CEF68093.1 Aldolase-type TIM barrel domain and Glycoside hydrolase, superfamily domain and Hyaluronidase family-containing protein [Strongyloides ratti]
MKVFVVANFICITTISQALFPIPTKIYWNIATNTCLKKGINIPLENYDLISNNDQHFYGENIVTLYEKHVGLYPYLIKVNDSYNQFINGGLPQNVDLNKHLEKLKENVNRIIPNKKFNGLAVIDIEKWRPLFEANWLSKNIYRKESIDNVFQKYPNISQNASIKLGEKEFDESAFNFMIKTIKVCKLLRPFAKWGFYGFPICDMNGYKRKNKYCYHDINEKMIQFLKYVDALYPTAYIYGGHSYDNQKEYIRKVLKETKRLNQLLEKFGYGKKEIYMFHKIEVYNEVSNNRQSNFYDPYQLCISQGQSIVNDLEGIIIWSTSNDISKRCEILKQYVELQFGPYLEKIGNLFDICKNKKSPDEICNKLMVSKNDKICSDFLTPESVKQWCNVEFYGEKYK